MSTEPGPDPTDELTLEPLEPAPDGLDEFDAWARKGDDAWHRAEVHQEAGRRWADQQRPVAERLLAGIWGAGSGNPVATDLLPLLDDAGLDPVLAARARVAAALTLVAADPARAVEFVESALGVMADDVAFRTRLAVWLAAVEVLARTGRIPAALKVLDEAGRKAAETPGVPPWAAMAVDAERLMLMAPGVKDRKQLAPMAAQIASAAVKLPPTPTAIDISLKMSSLLVAAGAGREAERIAERVVAFTRKVPTAVGVLFQAQMVLADARLLTDGPEAALPEQLKAIAILSTQGPSPMLGLAWRGVGMTLRQLERNEESAEAFRKGAAAYAALGMTGYEHALRLDGAESLFHAEKLDEARELIEEVRGLLAEVDEAARAPHEMQANRILAYMAAEAGDLDTAAEHWLEVADLAPTAGLSDLEARLTAAQLYALDGDHAESDAQFLRAELSAAEAPDPAGATAEVMRVRAQVLRESGRSEEAAEHARLAANHARTSGDLAQAVYLLVVAGDSLHQAGNALASVQVFEEAVETAREAKMTELEATVHVSFAAVLKAMGRGPEAEVHEAQARALGR